MSNEPILFQILAAILKSGANRNVVYLENHKR